MDVRTEISYPSTPPGAAFMLAMDPEFRNAVCEATHASEYDVSIDQHEGGATVRISRTVPATVPDLVKKFVGDTITVIQTEEWGAADAGGGRRASLRIDIAGQPAKLVGSIELEPAGQGSVQRIVGTLTISIPFLGKKIEPEVAKAILAGARVEQRTGQEWLSQRS